MATTASLRHRVATLPGRTPAAGTLALTIALSLASAALGLLLVDRPTLFWLLAGLLLGLLLAYLTTRYPGPALVALVGLAQVYPIILSQLVGVGVPLSSALEASLWKEIIAVTLGGMVLARGTSRWRAVDGLAAAYLGLLLAYVLVPYLAALYPARGIFVDATRMLQSHFVAAREDGMLLVVFLAARHLTSGERTFRQLETVALVSGAAFALIGVWNVVSPIAWSRWQGHLTENLGGFRPAFVTYDVTGGAIFVRAGSVFQSYLDLAYYLVIPIGLVIARIAHRRARPWHLAVLLTCVLGLTLTLTRSAIFTVPLMVGLALLTGRERGMIATSTIVGALVVVPVAVTVGLVQRLGPTIDLTDPGTAGHLGRVMQSVDIMRLHPLGLGLAAVGDQAARFLSPTTAFYNENWYLQIGTETGWAGFALFTLAMVFILRELWHRAREGSPAALGALCALAALAAGGLVLHTFQDLPVAWAGMALAGTACGFATASRPGAVIRG